MKHPKFQLWVCGIIVVLVIIVFLIPSDEDPVTKGTQSQTTAPAQAASEAKPPPTAIPTTVPIIFSDEQASAFLLVANDFPKNWTKKGNTFQNDYLTDYNVKMIKITLQTHETEAAAQTAFSAKKAEAQTTIDESGFQGTSLRMSRNTRCLSGTPRHNQVCLVWRSGQ